MRAGDKNLHFWKTEKYTDIISILGAHKFWESEPIMLLRKKKKAGEIR